MIHWLYLLVAGILECAWAIGLKYTEGFSRLWPSVFTVIALAFSFYFLSLSLAKLPIGTAYAIWTGIGAVGVAILGVVLFGEPYNTAKVVCIGLIVAGILGLKITSA